MSGVRTGSNIRIDGVKGTIEALRAFTPEVEKVLGNAIKENLKDIAREAQVRYPDGKWVVGRSKKKLLGYVSAARGGRRAARWGDSGGGIKAAIFEFVGVNYTGNRPQVVGLIDSLNARYGTPGRFLWAAWDQSGAGVLERIEQAVRDAEADLQAMLDAAGEEY